MPASPTLTTRAGPTRRRVGLLSTYPPRLCGLATFAAALERSLSAAGDLVTVVAVQDSHQGHTVSTAADHALVNGDPSSLRDTIDVLSQCDVVIVQHEYGVFGGVDGDEVIELLRDVSAPTIVVLHTVPSAPTPHQREVLETVASLATLVVVMTSTAGARLTNGYDVDATRMVTIPHGAWSLRPLAAVSAAGPARPQLLTWGLLGPGKGIEHVLRALPLLDDIQPRVRYMVAGATHPNVFGREGDRYRTSLIELARVNGVAERVDFDDAYRDIASLERLVRSASVVVLPYDSRDQVTSGVLVDAIAAGRPVIATAFPHAVELLSSGAGIIVPHGDPAALADAIRATVSDQGLLESMRARAREIAPTLSWSTVAGQYRALFEQLAPSTSAVTS